MAEVTVTAIVNLRVTDSEWKLIMKALAAFAGVKINTNGRTRKEAEELNRVLLMQRRQDLRDQLEMAESALKRADEAANEPNMMEQFTTEKADAPVISIPPDTPVDPGLPLKKPEQLPKGWAK